LFDRPKPTVGCSANGGGRRRRKEEEKEVGGGGGEEDYPSTYVWGFQILSSLPVFQIKFSKHFSPHMNRSALLIPLLKRTDIWSTAQTTSPPP